MKTLLTSWQATLLQSVKERLAEYSFDKRKHQDFFRSFAWGKWKKKRDITDIGLSAARIGNQ